VENDRRSSGRIRGHLTRVVGVDLGTGSLELLFGIVDGNAHEEKDFMGEKDPEAPIGKDDELVAIGCLEPTTVHVPRSRLTRLVKAQLLFLPHQEGGGECLHSHDDIDLHPYTLRGFRGRMLQAPVLFCVPEEVVFDEAAIIVAIKGDKWIWDIPVGHQHHLFIQRRSLIVPGFDHHGIERNRLVALLVRVGLGALGVEPVTGQKTRYADQFDANLRSYR